MKALRDSETKYIAVLIHVIYPYSRKKTLKTPEHYLKYNLYLVRILTDFYLNRKHSQFHLYNMMVVGGWPGWGCSKTVISCSAHPLSLICSLFWIMISISIIEYQMALPLLLLF